MKKQLVRGGIAVALIGLLVILGLLTPRPPVEAQSYPRALTIYESGRITTGGAATVTLTNPGLACAFMNEDATDSITLKFNGSTASIRLIAKASYNADVSTNPVVITSFNTTAVANTPVMDWICWELNQ